MRWVVCLACAVGRQGSGAGEQPVRAVARNAVAPGAAAGGAEAAKGDADLQTDFDADLLLRRAREFLSAPEPQYHKAALVLQHLIDTAGDALATEDHLVYHPVRRKAERLLADMPDVGLETYRAEVDGLAQALLGTRGRSRDEEALRIVADRFFLSSRGDEAAFVLGCLYLDQHQYLRARRIFLRILRHHPAPSVPEAAILLRLALACGRSGDAEGARDAWDKLQGRQVGLPPEALAAVRREALGQPASATQAAQRPATATLPAADGRFPDLPAELLERPRGLCTVASQFEFSLAPVRSNVRVHIAGQTVRTGTQGLGAMRDHLLARWEQCGWFPTGELRFRDGCAYFKAAGGVVCLETRTGKVRWESKPPQPPKTTRSSYVSFSSSSFRTGMPTQAHEIPLFGDRVAKQVGLLGDALYHIAEHHQAHWARTSVVAVVVVNGKRVVRQAKQVSQGNRLVALDARTGKLRWQRGRTLDEKDPLRAVRFLSLPVPCGGRLLAVVENRSELSLVALEPETGELAWRTFLCAYTAPMRAPWYGVGLARHGSEVYVSTGQGVVLALDGIDGSIRWASRYERQFHDGGTRSILYGRAVMGWQENRVFPLGGRLVVLPSDAERILTFDAHSGLMLRALAATGMRYCLGLADGSLFVGSDSKVRRIAFPAGKVVWELELPGGRRACGRGFLTDDALYLPSGRHLVRVAAATGRVDSTLRVDLPDDEPVGNVFSDGSAFAVYGLGRVYTLRSGAVEMAEVSRRLAQLRRQHDAAKPPEPDLVKRLADAYLARARLHEGYERLEAAVDDCRVAARELGQHGSVGAAQDRLFGLLLGLAGKDSKGAAERIREALSVARDPARKAEAVRALAADHERRGRVAEAAASLLGVMQDGGSALVELAAERGTWRVRPDLLVARDVRRLLARHGEQVAQPFALKAEAALAAARAKRSYEAFQAVLRVFAGTSAATAAGLEAAALEDKGGVFEKAELILCEMASAGHRPTAAAGLAALASLHERRGWLRQAHAEWTLLADQFPDQPVPLGGERVAAGALARERLAAKPFAGADVGPAKGLPEPPWRRLWETTSGKSRYLQVLSLAQVPRPGSRGVSQFLEEHIFIILREKTSRFICRRVRDGATLYEQDMATTASQRTQYPHSTGGHVTVWMGSGSSKVFGLVSGKVLWEAKASATGLRRISSSTRTAAGGLPQWAAGVVAMRPRPSTVRVVDLATGRALWERTFRGMTVSTVQSAGPYLLIATGRNAELWVCDAFSGEKLGTLGLQGRYTRAQVMTRHGLVCQSYTTGRTRQLLTLYELPSGKTRWTWEAKQHPRSLQLLDADTLCVVGTDGTVQVVDVATGKPRAKMQGEGAGRYVYGVCLSADGKHLYASGYGMAKDNKRTMTLTVFDLAAGKRLQTFTYGESRYVRPTQIDALARSGRLLPLVVQDPPTKQGKATRPSQLCRVRFYRRADGQCEEGLALPSSREDGKFEKLRSIHVQDGALIVVLYSGVQVFGHGAQPAGAPEREAAADKQAEAP